MSQHLDFLTSKYRYSLDMVNAIWVSIFACLVGRLFDFRGHSMSDFDFNLFLVQKKMILISSLWHSCDISIWIRFVYDQIIWWNRFWIYHILRENHLS